MLATQKTSPLLADPHSVSNTLDAETSSRIIERLESRGKDTVFRELFQSFFAQLHGCAHVLEIGCGTGVVLRSLLRDPCFTGTVTGLDQSAAFIEAARVLAAEEGLPPERISFAEADAARLPPGQYDAVILNTLISHVDDPATVLAQAAAVAAPGAVLIVMDGDYGSLTYAHPEDAELGRRMDRAFVTAVYAQPDAVRELPGKLRLAGWRLESVRSKCVSEVGGHAQASFWLSYAKAYMARVVQAGLVAQGQVDGWWQNQQRALDEDRFFAAASYYTFVAKRVGDED
jgi:ubiquinone/menaquinone biosynthesis C-methylase UbiE